MEGPGKALAPDEGDTGHTDTGRTTSAPQQQPVPPRKKYSTIGFKIATKAAITTNQNTTIPHQQSTQPQMHTDEKHLQAPASTNTYSDAAHTRPEAQKVNSHQRIDRLISRQRRNHVEMRANIRLYIRLADRARNAAALILQAVARGRLIRRHGVREKEGIPRESSHDWSRLSAERILCESQPESWSSSVRDVEVQAAWVMKKTRENKVFYYNRRSKERVWRLPAGAQLLDKMQGAKLRKGNAASKSSPSLRESDLRIDSTKTNKTGSTPCTPSSKVLTSNVEDEWIVKNTKEGRRFYYNRHTKQRVWRLPDSSNKACGSTCDAPPQTWEAARTHDARPSTEQDSFTASTATRLDTIAYNDEGSHFYIDDEGFRVRKPGLEQLYQNPAMSAGGPNKFNFTIRHGSASRCALDRKVSSDVKSPDFDTNLPPPPRSGRPRHRV